MLGAERAMYKIMFHRKCTCRLLIDLPIIFIHIIQYLDIPIIEVYNILIWRYLCGPSTIYITLNRILYRHYNCITFIFSINRYIIIIIHQMQSYTGYTQFFELLPRSISRIVLAGVKTRRKKPQYLMSRYIILYHGLESIATYIWRESPDPWLLYISHEIVNVTVEYYILLLVSVLSVSTYTRPLAHTCLIHIIICIFAYTRT